MPVFTAGVLAHPFASRRWRAHVAVPSRTWMFSPRDGAGAARPRRRVASFWGQPEDDVGVPHDPDDSSE